MNQIPIREVMGDIFGMRVCQSPHIPRFQMKQVKFPKTKRKRIQKKWKKDNTNFKQIPIKHGYILNNNTLVIHPDDLHNIKHMIKPNQGIPINHSIMRI